MLAHIRAENFSYDLMKAHTLIILQKHLSSL